MSEQTKKLSLVETNDMDSNGLEVNLEDVEVKVSDAGIFTPEEKA